MEGCMCVLGSSFLAEVEAVISLNNLLSSHFPNYTEWPGSCSRLSHTSFSVYPPEPWFPSLTLTWPLEKHWGQQKGLHWPWMCSEGKMLQRLVVGLLKWPYRLPRATPRPWDRAAFSSGESSLWLSWQQIWNGSLIPMELHGGISDWHRLWRWPQGSTTGWSLMPWAAPHLLFILLLERSLR